MRLLDFAGRSAPEGAAGLNRFGFIQELSRNPDGANVESMYFGLMTSSPEESAAEARKALHSNARDSFYSAIEGHIAAGFIDTTNARFVAPAKTSPMDPDALIQRARQASLDRTKKRVEVAVHRRCAPAISARPGRLAEPAGFVGNPVCIQRLLLPAAGGKIGGSGRLRTSFARTKSIPPRAEVTRVSLSVMPEEGGSPSEFRLWIEKGMPHPLPLRIEYQPKSYLRLTFEAQA